MLASPNATDTVADAPLAWPSKCPLAEPVIVLENVARPSRSIDNGLARNAPASLYEDSWKRDPALPPLSVEPLPSCICHRKRLLFAPTIVEVKAPEALLSVIAAWPVSDES